MSESSLYAEPILVENVQDCFFYQRMEIPGVGEVGKNDGQWDLRDCITQYLGELHYRGKRALDVGTASGFLTFEMGNLSYGCGSFRNCYFFTKRRETVQ